MLSRIAESLYWIGRYVQRAEDTCRLLDVHLQLMVEDPTADLEVSAASLLAVLGLPPEEECLTTAGLLARLKDDPDCPGSFSASLRNAREAARRLRETVPPEAWEPLNTTWNEIRTGEVASTRPTASLTYLRQSCAVIAGIADDTMRHDEGWQLLRLGRCLEQFDMSVRLLMWTLRTQDATNVWSNALRAAGAMHDFRWARGATTEPGEAAQLLLMDPFFPRSVVHSLAQAADALAALDPGGWPDGPRTAAERALGRARSELEFLAPEEVLTDLASRLEDLQLVCERASEVVAERYFSGAAAPRWSEGSSDEAPTTAQTKGSPA